MENWSSMKQQPANVLCLQCSYKYSKKGQNIRNCSILNDMTLWNDKCTCLKIYIYIKKERTCKHMAMSQTEVSVFPLKVAILEPKRTPHLETYPYGERSDIYNF